MDRKRNRWVVQIRPVQVKGKKKGKKREEDTTQCLSKDKDIFGSEVSKSISTEYKTQLPSPQFIGAQVEMFATQTCDLSV